jgi:hypothetical protein
MPTCRFATATWISVQAITLVVVIITKAPRRMTTNNMQFDYADRRYAARCLVIYCSIVLEAVPSLGQQQLWH